jgi:hypothetical protein
MSAAASLEPPAAPDSGALVLSILGDEALPERAIWALTGLSRQVLHEVLETLADAGAIEETRGLAPAWRKRTRPVVVASEIRTGPRKPVEREPLGTPDPFHGVSEAGDRRLVGACLALGGVPRAERLADGRTVWLNLRGDLWRQGVPVRA